MSENEKLNVDDVNDKSPSSRRDRDTRERQDSFWYINIDIVDSFQDVPFLHFELYRYILDSILK